MNPRHRNPLLRRLDLMQMLAWIIILILAVTYGWVQIVMRRMMQDLAQRQALKVRTTPAPRGIIFDRNGHKLVDNRHSLNLVIQAEELPTDPAQVVALAQALQQDPAVLKRRIQASRQKDSNRMVVVMDNLDDAGVAQAEMLRARFPFLSVESAPRRVYLGDRLAGHVLGYVGEVSPEKIEAEPGKYQMGEIIGKSGFEGSRNNELKGRDGQRHILVDHLGREMALYGKKDPIPGRSVNLTLDAGLQTVLKEAYGEERGAAVVLDLRDGGVLAMYSSPPFDSNLFLNRLSPEEAKYFWNNPTRPMLNRATQGLYPPGSTYKLLVALAALDKGIINPETTFTCHGGKTFYSREFRCDAVHGTMNLIQAIAYSCDIYFYELGMRLDVDDIHAAAEKYGLTELTGVDLPHEIPCRIPSRAWKAKVGRTREQQKWYAGETISVAIGQGQNSVTPIGLARFYAMLATRGKLLTPHLLRGIRNETTGHEDVVRYPEPRDTGLDPHHWAVLDEGLYEVVRVGTAKASNIKGLEMVGKTGTSQVTTFVDKAHYSKLAKHLKDNALFAGYAPRDNPQIAFAIVVENAGFGASSAAPIAKRLCEYWFFQRPNNPIPPPRVMPPSAFKLEVKDDTMVDQ